MKKQSLILFALGFLSIACKKEGTDLNQKQQANNSLIAKYAGHANTLVDGGVMIQSFTTPASQNYPAQKFQMDYYSFNNKMVERVQVSNISLTKNRTIESSGGNLSYNNYDLDTDGKNIYGKTVKFALGGKVVNSTSTEPESEEMYVPQLIRILSIPTGPADEGSRSFIRPGVTITWNADPQNDKGVVMTIDYTATSDNQQFVDQGYKTSFYNPIITEDTGSYTFTEADFKGIPKGAYLSFSIGRCNFKIVTVEVDGHQQVMDLQAITSIGDFAKYQ